MTPTKEEIINYINELMQSEKEYINRMPPGCYNSYGHGNAVGRIESAKEILHFIETGEEYDY